MTTTEYAHTRAQEAHERGREALIAAIIKRVAELSGRSSPEDWPEAMLVTADELAAILQEEFDAEH